MFHNEAGGVSVMSTLFDPALIDTFVNRVDFLEKSITYILGTSSATNTLKYKPTVMLYPNPAQQEYSMAIEVSSKQNVVVVLTDVMGRSIYADDVVLNAGKNVVTKSIADIAAGMYMVRVTDSEGQTLYSGKLQKK
jgi:mannose/fructose-specific phosphotransferase system component IIA